MKKTLTLVLALGMALACALALADDVLEINIGFENTLEEPIGQALV